MGIKVKGFTTTEKILCCPKHGDTAHLFRKKGGVLTPICPKCAAEEAEKEKIKLREIEEHNKSIALKKKANEAGIGLRFVNSRLSDLTSENYYSSIATYIKHYALLIKEHGAPNIIFTGDVGVGKTYAVCAMAMELLWTNQISTLHYTTMFNLIESIHATWKPSTPITQDSLLNRIARYDLLIIDEMDATAITPSKREIISAVIDSRSANLKPIFVCMNSSIESYGKQITPSTYDKLFGHQSLIITKLGKSRRNE